jgi:hypothetical protein
VGTIFAFFIPKPSIYLRKSNESITRISSIYFFKKSSTGSAAPAGGAAAPAAGSAEVAPQVAAFDEFSAPTLKAFAEACATIGGPDAAACNELVVNAWSAQRAFLVMASQCKKPAKPEDMMALMKQCGVVDACQAAGKVRYLAHVVEFEDRGREIPMSKDLSLSSIIMKLACFSGVIISLLHLYLLHDILNSCFCAIFVLI